uniref:Putative secreted protein synganglion overexpressed n=1 Tax=Rhipicephalus microplus TaxID=6941 RepID=A0A6M2DCT9_RHIMP
MGHFAMLVLLSAALLSEGGLADDQTNGTFEKKDEEDLERFYTPSKPEHVLCREKNEVIKRRRHNGVF